VGTPSFLTRPLLCALANSTLQFDDSEDNRLLTCAVPTGNTTRPRRQPMATRRVNSHAQGFTPHMVRLSART